jgi:4-azaleucine resistance transporter AzlC
MPEEASSHTPGGPADWRGCGQAASLPRVDQRPTRRSTASRGHRGYRRDAAAIGLGVGVFGLTFGVLASAAGVTVLQASALSLLTFTGASQFALVGVLAAGGSPVAALGSALLLAARNGAYGLALSPYVTGSVPRRLAAAHLVIDESTAMGVGQEDPADVEGAFLATGLSIFVCWNGGTVIGALSGQAVGDPGALGLDVAFPAGFLALVAPHLRATEGRVALLSGGALALAALPLTPPGVPILLAVLGAVPAFLVARRRRA